MVELTRRPVKDKGALMQTLHLRFRALRAISSGQSPSRWQTPSMRSASKWETASPLPNPLRPTLAVGPHPKTSRQQFARCPTVGAGLPLASPFREPRVVGPAGAPTSRVCPRQTASELPPCPAHHKAGDLGAAHWQARASATLRAASPGPSFPLRPQRCEARSCGKKTVVRHPDGSGIVHSEATGFRPTGRLDHWPFRKMQGLDHLPSCTDTPSLVTGQETWTSHVRQRRLRLCSGVR